MVANVIGVFDGGFEKLFLNGKYINAGVIIFRTQENESAPVDHIGYCQPHMKDSIIKYLGKILWQPKPEKPFLKFGQSLANSLYLSLTNSGFWPGEINISAQYIDRNLLEQSVFLSQKMGFLSPKQANDYLE
jgi:hypothetical protein